MSKHIALLFMQLYDRNVDEIHYMTMLKDGKNATTHAMEGSTSIKIKLVIFKASVYVLL